MVEFPLAMFNDHQQLFSSPRFCCERQTSGEEETGRGGEGVPEEEEVSGTEVRRGGEDRR